MAFERFQRSLGINTQGVTNPNAGADAEFLVAELEQFSARKNNQLDEQAAEEAFQAGQQTEGGELREGATTIRDRAFNQGIMVSHQAALQTDIRDNVARLQLEHPNDPEAFEQKMTAMTDGLLAESQPAFQPFIKQRAADYAGRALIDITATQKAELTAAAMKDLEVGVEGFFDDARTAAFEGDILVVEARRQELQGLLNNAMKGGLTDEKAVGSALAEFEKAVSAQEIVGEFDRLVRSKGVEAGTTAIKNWQATKPSSVGMNVDEHEAIARQLIALNNRQDALTADETAAAKAAAAAEQKARSGRIGDAISVMKDGFPIDEKQARQLTEDLARTDDPELAIDFDIAQQIQGQVHRFRRMPELQRQEELDRLEMALRREGASRDELALLDSLNKTHTEVTQQLENDPLGYHEREGLIDLPPLNLESGEGLANSLAARGEAVDRASSIAGRPVPLLKAAEADALAEVYQAGTVEEQVGLLGAITIGAQDRSLATLSQLAAKGHDRMALVGEMVMTGRSSLAREVLRGQKVLAADPKIKPDPILSQSIVDSSIGAAFSDAPDVRRTYLEAAYSKYADLKRAEGDLTDVLDGGLLQDALEQVIPTASFNGRKVAVPSGVTDRMFRDWTKSWTADTFAGTALDVSGEEILEAVKDRGRLIEVGNGRYGVITDSANTDSEKLLTLENGKPLILVYPVAGVE